MEELLLWEFPPKVREWATLLFFWSGVAIWVGLAARFLVPARVVRGPWLTLCLGFVGSCLGPFALRSFFKLDRFDPIGPCGLVASVGVAVATLCLFYIVAFFFPPRFDDEEDANDEEEEEENDDGERVERGERGERGEAERRRERREPRRRQEFDRERTDRRERERDERFEYDRREYEPLEEPSDRDVERRSRPKRRR
jgi:uncharacterized membrane protein YeaQ/YmgE (transglycosylase-associated protein family)